MKDRVYVLYSANFISYHLVLVSSWQFRLTGLSPLKCLPYFNARLKHEHYFDRAMLDIPRIEDSEKEKSKNTIAKNEANEGKRTLAFRTTLAQKGPMCRKQKQANRLSSRNLDEYGEYSFDELFVLLVIERKS